MRRGAAPPPPPVKSWGTAVYFSSWGEDVLISEAPLDAQLRLRLYYREVEDDLPTSFQQSMSK